MKLKYYSLLAPFVVIKLWDLISSMFGIEQNHVRVLLYHEIDPADYQNFESNLLWLKKRWKFITPVEFEKHISGEVALRGRCLLLTFDDGFKSNRIIAEKILEKLDIKAIFFVVTNYINQSKTNESQNFYVDNIMPRYKTHEISVNITNMNWEDLRWLSSHGHEIGAHTMNHARLSEISEKSVFIHEIIDSGNEIESKLGKKITHFAYTFGDIGSFSFKALQYASDRYNYIYSGLRGNNTSNVSRTSIRRDAMDPSSPKILLNIFLSGSADVWYRNSRVKLDEWSRLLIF